MNNLDKIGKSCREIGKTIYDGNIKGILYLIGIQELNFGIKRFSREEKTKCYMLQHVKNCSGFGYYKFVSVSEDRWPTIKKLRQLKT